MPVCIAGMHRSGTSMVARLLQACGLYLGPEADLVPAARDNPEGFFENVHFVQVNDVLLALLHGGWDLAPKVPADWPQLPHLQPVRDRAAEILGQFSGREPWGWKDPRNSLALPFWMALLPDLKVLICLRHPLEVARSLTNRGFSSQAFGLDLWATYNQRLLALVPPHNRVITHYDSYFYDAPAELTRVLALLRLDAGADVIREACTAASLHLRHNHSPAADLLQPQIPLQIPRLYAAMCAEAGEVYQRMSQQLPDTESLVALNNSTMLAPRELALESPLVLQGAADQELAARSAENEQITRRALQRLAAKDLDRATIHQLQRQLTAERQEHEQIQTRLRGELSRVLQSRAWGLLHRVAIALGRSPKPAHPTPSLSPSPGTGGRSEAQSKIQNPKSKIPSLQSAIGNRQSAIPLVSILIPVYNNLSYTRQAVESMLSCADRASFEIIVINNHSFDGTRPWLDELARTTPNLRPIHNDGNLGFAAAINEGFAAARGRYIVIANNDILVPPHWLDALIAAAESAPDLGIVSPVTNHVGEGPQRASEYHDLGPTQFLQAAQILAERPIPLRSVPDRLVFFCVLIKRELYELLGGLSGLYGLGNYEDDDLCLRARLAGYRLAVVPNLLVYHYGSRTFATQNIPHAELMESNRRRFHQRLADFAVSNRRSAVGSRQPTTPLVSVLVRTQNRPTLLRTALTSLANQTFRDFEVVLVNDGGDDLSALVEGFTGDLRIRHIAHATPKGRSAALNAAAAAASGKWITYLDDDDIVYPHHLDVLVDAVHQHPDTRVFYTDANYALLPADDDRAAALFRMPADPFHFDPDELLVQNRLPIMTVLHARDCFETVGRFDESMDLLEDWDFWLRLSRRERFQHVPRTTCEYRFRADANVDQSIAGRRREAVAAVQHIHDRYPVTDPRLLDWRRSVCRAMGTQAEHLQRIARATPDPNLKRYLTICCSANLPLRAIGWVDNRPYRANVCAVVITYHPDDAFPQRLQRIAQQVDHVVIVDNGSHPPIRQMLRDLAAAAHVELIQNDQNLGVATALNQGSARARELGYTWMLSMDQDTVVEPDLVEELAGIYTDCPERESVAMLSSNFRDPHLNISVLIDNGRPPRYLERLTTVTSGSLVSLSAIQRFGGFRDDLFIDSVDNEFCLRLRVFGQKCLLSRKVLMHHAIGQARFHRFAFLQVSSLNHPPIRRYYMTRNRLEVARIYFGHAPRWNLSEIAAILRDVAVVLLCERRKIAKLHAMTLGAWHGLRRRLGKLEPHRWES